MPTKVQSQGLNEELGQINYIFSDKTGTLTQNVMDFRKFSAGHHSYGMSQRVSQSEMKASQQCDGPLVSNVNFYIGDLKKDLEEGSENHVKVKEMLLNLSLNHTVILGSLGKYCASSPDELALVNAAKFCGYEFESRDQRENTISIKIKGQVQTYRLLQLIDFTSARKRMTCVLETPSGEILVLCKGADSIVLPLCHKSDEALKIKTQAFIDDYANDGLRTLVLAQKKLTRSEYDKWNRKYQDAILSIKGREELLEECALELEQNFDISGSTAIEDRLQDNVAESIIHIRKAGIVIWVLTGDKIETAINVGYSSGLLDNSIN